MIMTYFALKKIPSLVKNFPSCASFPKATSSAIALQARNVYIRLCETAHSREDQMLLGTSSTHPRHVL